jgi:hypothetical protein
MTILSFECMFSRHIPVQSMHMNLAGLEAADISVVYFAVFCYSTMSHCASVSTSIALLDAAPVATTFHQ